MPAKDPEGLSKTCIRLYTEDLEWLRRFYGSLKYNRAVRLLVRKHRTAVERKLETKLNTEEAE